MSLSHQTYTGILINVHSIIQMVLYLLRDGTYHNYCYNDDIQKIILTEENFGCHRTDGRRNEHCIISVMTQI